MRSLVAVLALVPAALGCQDPESAARQKIIPRLKPLASCEAAITHVREVALEKMNRVLDENFKNYQRGHYCGRGGWGNGAEDDQPSPSPGGGGGGGGGPKTGTGTNNQVAGVDEADFVKNDGQYIYLAQNGVLRIVDSWPADQTHQVSATALEGVPKKLFVQGDRALVYVAIGDDTPQEECTYGYDCSFNGDGTTTRALVFDISNRAAPRLERVVALPGSLIAGRRIGNTVHSVVMTNPDPFAGLDYFPQDADLCDFSYELDAPPLTYRARAKRAFDDLRERNREIIEATDITAILPVVNDSAHETDTSACTSMYASQVTDGAAFLSVASLDLTQNSPVALSTIVSRAGAVYASSDSLYLAVPHQSDVDEFDGATTSCIHKFAIGDSPGATSYIGSGTVVGRPLNQFAMDEQDGFLRIATTDGHVPDPNVESRLTVLAEDGDSLVTVGLVDNIAPTEDIRSVRFDGDRAFIVTFKKTDPLFSFDLSDPTKPKQLGELKIPGFSTYMHMLDANHLLSIGYDADDHGDFAYFDGVLLQVFDVTDPTTPTLAHRHVIGTRGSSSEALTNHLAFTWYREESLLAVPMTLCEGGDDGEYGEVLSFSGLMLFDVSTSTGIAEHGRVKHPVPTDITCNNWWTDTDSAVKRSLFLERWVYSISDAHLKVQSIDALGTDLVSLPLE
jgi:hypothetical protein